MAKIQAFCGLDCGDCEAYIATQKNDRDRPRGGRETMGRAVRRQSHQRGYVRLRRLFVGKKDELGPRGDVRDSALRDRARRDDLRPLPGLRLRNAEGILRFRRPLSGKSWRRSGKRSGNRRRRSLGTFDGSQTVKAVPLAFELEKPAFPPRNFSVGGSRRTSRAHGRALSSRMNAGISGAARPWGWPRNCGPKT